MQKLTYWFLAIFSLFFLAYNALVFFDADFGWHLKFGQLILTSGFPKVDPFSYTMPSFKPIEHEWLIDILYSKLFPIIGIAGMALMCGGVGLSSIALSLFGKKELKIKTFLLILAASSFQPFFTISPKIFSFMLWALLTILVFDKKLWLKYWFLAPLIFMFWVNTHGSFALGIVTLLAVLIIRSYIGKKIQAKEWLVLVLSILVTFINPYGGKIWLLVFDTLKNSQLHSFITEWRPAYVALTQLSFPFIFLVSLSAVFYNKYRAKIAPEKLLISLVLLFLTVVNVRYMHYWIIFSLPLIYEGVVLFKKEFNNKSSNQKLNKTLHLITVSAFVFLIYQILHVYSLSKESYGVANYYPVGAVNFLNKNIPEGNVFSEYKWGGYLVWQLPQKKVFINGMMPVWNNASAAETESKNAFKEYLSIVNGNSDYKNTFVKYKIDTILIDKAPKPIKENLIRDGWLLVYEDKSALIYRKP